MGKRRPVLQARLQDNEIEAVCDCGCVLKYDENDNAAWYACKTHERAEHMRTVLAAMLMQSNNSAKCIFCGAPAGKPHVNGCLYTVGHNIINDILKAQGGK